MAFWNRKTSEHLHIVRKYQGFTQTSPGIPITIFRCLDLAGVMVSIYVFPSESHPLGEGRDEEIQMRHLKIWGLNRGSDSTFWEAARKCLPNMFPALEWRYGLQSEKFSGLNMVSNRSFSIILSADLRSICGRCWSLIERSFFLPFPSSFPNSIFLKWTQVNPWHN